MSVEPVIRQARAEDAEAAGDLAVRAWQGVFLRRQELLGAEIFETAYPDWQGAKRAQVIEHMRKYPQWALVTELDGRIVGFITWHFWPDGKVGEIDNNAVDPDCRGRGIGTAQCSRALEAFREGGCTVATVGTGLDEAHAPARRMYAKVGFGPSFQGATCFLKLGGSGGPTAGCRLPALTEAPSSEGREGQGKPK